MPARPCRRRLLRLLDCDGVSNKKLEQFLNALADIILTLAKRSWLVVTMLHASAPLKVQVRTTHGMQPFIDSRSFARPRRSGSRWIVRASDNKCLVVDIEPTVNDKIVTKVGEVYQTGAGRSRREKALQGIKGRRSAALATQETPIEIA
jgi:hypothetical protein